MTDTQLVGQAEGEFKQCTAGWLKPNGQPRYPSGPPVGSHWYKGLQFLQSISAGNKTHVDAAIAQLKKTTSGYTATGKYWQAAFVELDKVANPAPPPASEWQHVADENYPFTLTENSEVRFGKNSAWTTEILAPGTYACTNTQFGGDPAPNVYKECQVHTGVVVTPPPPPPPPPPPTTGAPLTRFAHFQNKAFGPDVYPGGGAIFNRKCDPSPSSNGFDNQGVVCPKPWSDGWSGIFEITEPGKGDGLDFRFGPGMPRASGHGLQIADIHHILNGFPVDFDLEWDHIFPASGNPNGFPPWPGDPTTDEWNVIIEFTDAGYQSNGICVANFIAPKPRWLVTAGNGIDNQKRSAKSSFTIAMDTWYHIHYQGRLSKSSDGWLKLDITPEGQATERVADWSGPTSNPADGGPYVELGQYGMNTPGRNQMKIINMWNHKG